MPSEGIELSPSANILSDAEVIRLASLFVKSGVTKIRLTGGEPTVRKGLGDLIASLNDLRQYGLRAIGMTTNGLALHRRLPEFVANGLSHLNISLDTLDPFKFEIMTRRRGHEAVLQTLHAALSSSSLESVKLNVVVVKGLNDSEVLDFVEMTKDKALSVRFIEFMPFTGNQWDKEKMIPSDLLLERISARHPNVQRISDETNDTARSWKIPDYTGSFGFISSMSDHFCSSCNRLRVTADGQIKVCLFDATEVSLRDRMRSGANDADLLQIIGRAVSGKLEKHAHMEDIDVVHNRPMILIGGSATLVTRRFSPLKRFNGRITSHIRGLSTSSVRSDRELTHLDHKGRPTMVDVSLKQITKRTATATGRISIPEAAYDLIVSPYSTGDDESDTQREKARRKGDALTVAQLAAIMGSKKTSDLIPLCHPLALSNVSVTLTPETKTIQAPDATDSSIIEYSIICRATVSSEGKTGVEMEALTAVSIGLLTVWDMLKAVAGKEMEIGEIYVSKKTGGKSGDFIRA
ncbi:molybdenum cofactor biosynthesis prote [Mycena floridula]|nr:molybdenum cofactor biosynthesis prote [Mycena floridula]